MRKRVARATVAESRAGGGGKVMRGNGQGSLGRRWRSRLRHRTASLLVFTFLGGISGAAF